MVVRSYSAASKVARYGDFSASRGSADYELHGALAEVRAKTRNLARNSGTIKRYVQLMCDNVVGDMGFSLQAPNSRIEEAWRRWCDNPTVDGSMSMIDLCDQMVGSWCRDGEFLIEFVVNPEYPDMLALNPLEADMLDETMTTQNPRTKNQIKMGVEIDVLGRPVAYWILTSHPGDIASGAPRPRQRHRRVPADRILHVFQRLRAGQTRGEPPAGATVNAIKMLDGYREAEVMNRRIAASTMGFFTRETPKADGIDALGVTETDEEGNEEVLVDVQPGTFKQLPDGMRFDKFDPGGSQTDYHAFEGQVKKEVSMALGISAFALGMETAGVSYSTGRSVIQEDRDFYKRMQGFFIRMAMRPMFRKWATQHVLMDGSSIPPTRLQSVVNEIKFRGRGWTWIDPAKDISANAEALATYQTSHSKIAADRGMDVTDLFEEIKRDRELMAQFGLTPIIQNDKPSPKNEGPVDDE